MQDANTLNLNSSHFNQEEAGFTLADNDNTSQEEKVQIPVSELDLLQSCQKIIDAASSMKCL